MTKSNKNLKSSLNVLGGIEAPDYSNLLDEEDGELWNEILPNLYQGGTDDFDIIGNSTYAGTYGRSRAYITKEYFDTVVTMYQYANPVDWFVAEYRYCIYDADIAQIDLPRLYETARYAYDAWTRGDRVLIRCQAGWNRSGLVMALVLMLDGIPAREAIDLIRRKRSKYALCNRQFERFLLELDPADIRRK